MTQHVLAHCPDENVLARCPDENMLALLSEDALDAAERLAIERHLDGCAPCTRLVGELATLVAPSRSAPKRYRILRQLGEGAMGVVWEAEDANLQRRVALKFVRPEGVGDRERRTRLFREARALAQLRHPNVVSVYDAGELGSDGSVADELTESTGSATELFLALELVVGTNARTWRAAASRTCAEILAVWKQAAAGIAAVHRAGIVHRDIKPDNVLVSDDGRVLVGDFGLATGELGAPTTTLTVEGVMVGTPLYMSPEQLSGDPATAKSDQFALCTSIWEALVGQRPFSGGTVGAIAIAMTKPLALPRSGERAVFGVLARGLDPDPARRYPDVDALITALALGAAPRRRRVRYAIGALGLGALVAVAAVAMTTTDRAPRSLATVTETPSPPGVRLAEPPPVPTAGSGSGSGVAIARTPSPAPSPTPGPAPGQGVVVRTPTSPIPVQPHPVVVPAVRSTWAQALTLATDKLQAGDGAACLQVLSTIPAVPADQADVAETTRLSCRMATGDCVGARSAIEAYGQAHGWAADRTRKLVESIDAMHCPIGALPIAGRVERARTQLLVAVSMKRSCRPVLAVMQQLGLQLADPKEQLGLEAGCAANAGDCTTARAKFRQLVIPANTDPQQLPAAEQRADAMFVRSFRTCP